MLRVVRGALFLLKNKDYLRILATAVVNWALCTKLMPPLLYLDLFVNSQHVTVCNLVLKVQILCEWISKAPDKTVLWSY